MNPHLKIGNKVLIKRRDIYDLKNKYGYVKSVRGNLLLLQPDKCKWIIELYKNEVEK